MSDPAKAKDAAVDVKPSKGEERVLAGPGAEQRGGKKGKAGLPKQTVIPGFQSPKLAAIEEAAEEYAEARDERMAAGEIEVKLKDKLLGLMSKHALTQYKRGPVSIAVGSKATIKVKIKDESEKDHSKEEVD